MHPDQIIQNYRLVRFIGDGGMGQVWLAVHTLLNRQVAIKCLHPQFARNEGIRQRFKQEASTLSLLQHPGIVAMHDYIEDEGGAYLVMEYVDGIPLDDYIRDVSGPLPEAALKSFFTQILEGFEYAHSKRIIHRDIKPGNFLITPSGKVKILDFGIAKILGATDRKLTKTGVNMGTILYMSPEQVKGDTVDQRSDIYALGVTLMQMATGRSPYPTDTTEFYVYDQIVNHPLPPARELYPGVSPGIQKVIEKATAKKPEDRFQEVSAFLMAIRNPETWVLEQPEVIVPSVEEIPVVSTSPFDKKATAEPISAENIAPSISPKIEKPRRRRSPLRRTLLWILIFIIALFLAALAGDYFGKGRFFGFWKSNTESQLTDNKKPTKKTNTEAERRKKLEAEKREREFEEKLRIEAEKKEIRNGILSYVSASGSEYSYRRIGGIYDYRVTVENQSEYWIDVVEIGVLYYKQNGGIYKTEKLHFRNLGPHTSQELAAPDSDRGTSVQSMINSIRSKYLNLCYNGEVDIDFMGSDPYFCE